MTFIGHVSSEPQLAAIFQTDKSALYSFIAVFCAWSEMSYQAKPISPGVSQLLVIGDITSHNHEHLSTTAV
jgi:hypothetical protein